MADKVRKGDEEVRIVDPTSQTAMGVDSASRGYVATEGQHQSNCERKRLYGLVTETNVPTSIETRILLIRNPSGSGKVMYLQRLVLLLTNTSSSSAVMRFYLQPTIIANGVAATIVNTNIGGGGAASVLTAFTVPTISVNGTFAYATRVQGGDGAQPTVVDFEGSIAINPGIDILVTITPDGNDRNTISTFLWLEK